MQPSLSFSSLLWHSRMWKKYPPAKRRVGTGRKRPEGNFFSIPSSFAPLFLAANLSRPEEAFLPPPPPIPSPPQKGRKGLVLLRRLQRSRMELTSPTTSSFFFPPTTIYFPPVRIIRGKKKARFRTLGSPLRSRPEWQVGYPYATYLGRGGTERERERERDRKGEEATSLFFYPALSLSFSPYNSLFSDGETDRQTGLRPTDRPAWPEQRVAQENCGKPPFYVPRKNTFFPPEFIGLDQRDVWAKLTSIYYMEGIVVILIKAQHVYT